MLHVMMDKSQRASQAIGESNGMTAENSREHRATKRCRKESDGSYSVPFGQNAKPLRFRVKLWWVRQGSNL